jgi:hypothetical protein
MKTYISHQKARTFGVFAYNMAKRGYMAFVPGGILKYTIDGGFYVEKMR